MLLFYPTVKPRAKTVSVMLNQLGLCLQVYYCKEDEVCLYQSLLFEVTFREESPESNPEEITLAYVVKTKASTNSLQLPVAG